MHTKEKQYFSRHCEENPKRPTLTEKAEDHLVQVPSVTCSVTWGKLLKVSEAQ